MKKVLALILAAAMMLTLLVGCGSTQTETKAPEAAASGSENSTEASSANEDPVKIRIYYSDNATLPFREDWLTVTTAEKMFNVDFEFEVIPIADYSTKVSLALNTGTNVPDVILYQSTTGENASLALNGAIVPISDYPELTPNFNARVEEFGMQEDVDNLKLGDGKRYYMPALFDSPFYDGGLILRQDFLES